MVTRRDFLSALAASTIFARSLVSAQTAPRHPRLLIAATDPFTGLNILKSRYAAGRRPSEDIAGWALSWQITKQKDFAERALADMKAKHITATGKPSRAWIDYARWALAFDWLSERYRDVPKFVVGHSIGEVTAACSSGSSHR